jgi:type IV/VI secretion system ImpK/VasF family protein
MANGRELFSDLIGYVLLFEQANQQGQFQPSYEQTRREIAALLEQEKAATRREGLPDRDYQDASFAVIAWADETILKHSSWTHHAEWNAFPLQLEYFQTRNAGEEFFDRLERLRPEQKAIRDVYYVCLGLGFSGRYFLGLEDELKLNQIRHEQAQHLSLPVEDIQGVGRLTPQPYDVRVATNGQIKPPWTDLLLKAGLPVLVLVPIVLGLIYWFWLAPSAPPRDGTSREVPLPERVKQWLDSHPEVLRCANVAVVEAQAGAVTVAGRVASEAQRASIRQGILSLDRRLQVKDGFEMIPWPFCEVLDLLEPLKKRNEAQAFGLTARLDKPGDQPLYYHNENFAIEVKGPTKFESYVYVDYYSTDETVGHLFPNTKETSNRLGPNRSFLVGQPNGPQPWLITPPFGRDLVTVIASKGPLFLQSRPAAEPVRTYLQDLRQALPRDPSTADVAATFYFIQTQDRP